MISVLFLQPLPKILWMKLEEDAFWVDVNNFTNPRRPGGGVGMRHPILRAEDQVSHYGHHDQVSVEE